MEINYLVKEFNNRLYLCKKDNNQTIALKEIKNINEFLKENKNSLEYVPLLQAVRSYKKSINNLTVVDLKNRTCNVEIVDKNNFKYYEDIYVYEFKISFDEQNAQYNYSYNKINKNTKLKHVGDVSIRRPNGAMTILNIDKMDDVFRIFTIINFYNLVNKELKKPNLVIKNVIDKKVNDVISLNIHELSKKLDYIPTVVINKINLNNFVINHYLKNEHLKNM
jgi:hypothetical protein